MEKAIKITVVSSLMMLLLAACGSTGVQVSVVKSLKAATARSINCPAEQINISEAEGTRSWTATACHKTYRCIGINLADELAECNVKTKSLSSGGASLSSANFSDY